MVTTLPLAVVFGAWVEYRSLSKERREWLETIASASGNLFVLSRSFQHWSMLSKNRTSLRFFFSSWSVDVCSTPAAALDCAAATTANATTANNNNTPHLLKSYFFCQWVSWIVEQQALHDAISTFNKKILFKIFVQWSKWTSETKARTVRHKRALCHALRKRQQRALSQWHLSTRLALVRRRHRAALHGGSTSSDLSSEDEEEGVLRALRLSKLARNKIAGKKMIPHLSHVMLQYFWSSWKRNVQHSLPIEQQILTIDRERKKNVLRQLNKGIEHRKRRMRRRKSSMLARWRRAIQINLTTSHSFCLHTIGRRALDRWIFVHEQRHASKIVASPRKGYVFTNNKKIALVDQRYHQHMRKRTLRLPVRGGATTTTTKKKRGGGGKGGEGKRGEGVGLGGPELVPLMETEAVVAVKVLPSSSSSSSSSPNIVAGAKPLWNDSTSASIENKTKSTNKSKSTSTVEERGQENVAPSSTFFSPTSSLAILPVAHHYHRPSWDITFNQLSSKMLVHSVRADEVRNNGTQVQYVSGDIVLRLLLRIGAFRCGWLRSLGGAYSLMRSAVGSMHDFGFQSIHLNRLAFEEMMTSMLNNNIKGKKGRKKIKFSLHHIDATTMMIDKMKKNIAFSLDKKLKEEMKRWNDQGGERGEGGERVEDDPLAHPAMFRTLSKIIRDKHERHLWSIFKEYGKRGRNDVMLVSMESFIQMAEDRCMIGGGSGGRGCGGSGGQRRRSVLGEASNSAGGAGAGAGQASHHHYHRNSSIHTGVNRRSLLKFVSIVLSRSNGCVHVPVSLNSRSSRIVTMGDDDCLSFPEFTIVVAHLALTAPDFKEGSSYVDRLEQMFCTMRM